MFMGRTFPLTKARTKQIKIGLNANDFKPLIRLEWERKVTLCTRPYITMTPEELHSLLSDEIHSRILNALETNTRIDPLINGNLNLTLRLHNNNFKSVVLENRVTEIEIFLGVLTWKKLAEMKGFLVERLHKIQLLSQEATLNFTSLLQRVRQHFADHGYNTRQSMLNLPISQTENMLKYVLENFLRIESIG